MRSLVLFLALAFLAGEACACSREILKATFIELVHLGHFNREYRWERDGVLGASVYSFCFQRFLGGSSVNAFLQRRKEAGLSTHVAEFFGSAVFVDDASLVDTATGVRLEKYYEPNGMPRRYDDDRYAPLRAPQWIEIAGNVFPRATWNALDDSMKERGIPAFDLIMVHPVGGIKTEFIRSGGMAEVAAITINRMYERLSSEQGVLLVTLQAAIPGHEAWTERLRAAGVTIDWASDLRFSFKITKTKNSPLRLPN